MRHAARKYLVIAVALLISKQLYADIVVPLRKLGHLYSTRLAFNFLMCVEVVLDRRAALAIVDM